MCVNVTDLFFLIIQCLVIEIWKVNCTLSYICASILRLLTNTILVIHINRNMSVCILTAALQWHPSVEQLFPLCVFDRQRGLGQYLCVLLRSDSMITTRMFGTLKVAVSVLARSFCPLSAFFLLWLQVVAGFWGNVCLLIFPWFLWEVSCKVIACPSWLIDDVWIYLWRCTEHPGQ